MNFDINWFTNLFPIVLSALDITIKISIVSLIFTLILSSIISIIRYYEVPIISNIFSIFITFFRATPLVAQLFILYFGLPSVFPVLQDMSAFQATVIALSFNTSAFMSENFRAALDSVGNDQIEACYSMAMTKVQTMRRVIIPQAFVVALPSIGNQFIGIIKGSALGFTVGLADIMAKAKTEAAVSLRFFEAYLCVTIIYLILVVLIEQIQKKLELKVSKLY